MLSRALSDLGCDVRVAVFRDPRVSTRAVEDHARSAGLSVTPLPCRGRWDWSAVRHLRHVLSEHSTDILHTHGYKADLYACAATWPHRSPLVATCHNWPDPRLSMQLYARLDRFVLRHFQHVTTPSRDVARVLQDSGVPVNKLTYVKNGVDVATFRKAIPCLPRHSGEKLVGFVGRMVPEKGGETLLRAARQVLGTLQNVRFVLVGDGPARADWERLAAELGIEPHVLFTGVRSDMPSIYAALDIFVLPSHNEAMPMSVLEAMAAGTPVITTRVGAIPKVVSHGENGHLCAPGDVDGLATSMLALLQSSEEGRRLGENGYKRVCAEFSSEAMAKAYLQLYKSVFRAHAEKFPLQAAARQHVSSTESRT